MLQFNAEPYFQAFQQGQNNETARRQQTLQAIQSLGQGMGQYQQQQKQDQMNQLLMKMKMDEQNRQNQESAYKYGTPINPDEMVGTPTPMFGRSSFMPGGGGNVATGSPLIDAHKQWLAGGMKQVDARPEYMGAMGQDERKMFFDQNSPEKLAEVNLKNAQAEKARREANDAGSDETYTIAGVDAGGNIIQVGNKTGRRRVIPNGGPMYPKDATDAQANAAGYGDRAVSSHKTIEDLFAGKLNPTDTSFAVQEAKVTPNFMKGGNVQSFDQAKRNFLNAILRRESGAVISPSEFQEGEKQYFPVYGDTPETLKQKSANRTMQIQNLKRSAGPLASSGSQGGSTFGGKQIGRFTVVAH